MSRIRPRIPGPLDCWEIMRKDIRQQAKMLYYERHLVIFIGQGHVGRVRDPGLKAEACEERSHCSVASTITL